MELSTYFRINEKNTGQFERTLIIADKGAYVSYLEGCTAPKRDENQLHAAVVELVALEDAEIKYSTVQNWYPGDSEGRGGIYNFVTKRGDCRGARSKISWTQVETGSAITWKYPSCILARRSVPRRILFDRHFERPSAGRQRHQDDSPRPEHDEPHHLQGRRRPGSRRTPIAARCRRTGWRPARATYTNCDLLLIGHECGAHTVPYIEAKNASAVIEHEATTSKVSGGAALLLPAAGLVGRGGDGADRQRLCPRRVAAAADGVCGRGAEADCNQPGRQRRMTAPAIRPPKRHPTIEAPSDA